MFAKTIALKEVSKQKNQDNVSQLQSCENTITNIVMAAFHLLYLLSLFYFSHLFT